LAGLGADITVGDLVEDAAAETAELVRAMGRRASAVALDITDWQSCQDAVAFAVSEHGSMHSMISTVGWSDTTFFVDEDPAYWRKIIDINLLGSVHISRAAVDHMRENGGGSIVLTSSDAGKVGTTGETVYAGAKAGVIGFVKSLAREVARYDIRVNAISPGPTDTALLRAQSHQGVVDKMVRTIPMRRMAQPEEQADAIIYFASDQSSFVTGQTLSVSGGLTMSS
jgi:NAD(P)-dependent dehydrogenase (short-subunit alcohol dehydrogenase family)